MSKKNTSRAGPEKKAEPAAIIDEKEESDNKEGEVLEITYSYTDLLLKEENPPPISYFALEDTLPKIEDAGQPDPSDKSDAKEDTPRDDEEDTPRDDEEDTPRDDEVLITYSFQNVLAQENAIGPPRWICPDCLLEVSGEENACPHCYHVRKTSSSPTGPSEPLQVAEDFRGPNSDFAKEGQPFHYHSAPPLQSFDDKGAFELPNPDHVAIATALRRVAEVEADLVKARRALGTTEARANRLESEASELRDSLRRRSGDHRRERDDLTEMYRRQLAAMEVAHTREKSELQDEIRELRIFSATKRPEGPNTRPPPNEEEYLNDINVMRKDIRSWKEKLSSHLGQVFGSCRQPEVLNDTDLSFAKT